MSYLSFINFFTTAILFVVSAWGGRRALKSCSNPDMAAPVVFILLIIFVLPVFLDLLAGIPHYDGLLASMDLARFDDLTAIIYNLYVAFIIGLFSWKIGDPRLRIDGKEFKSFTATLNRFSVLLYGLVFLPILLFPFCSSLHNFLRFGVERVYFEPSSLIDVILPKASVISVACATFLWHLNREKACRGKNVLLFCVIVLDCLFQGKRSLFFLACVFYLGLIYLSGGSLGMLIRRVAACSLLFSLFFIGYGKNIGSTFGETYVGLRGDFGRDDVLKYTIKKVLIDKEKIVNYPGQSFVFWGTFWIPRVYWHQKPWPYAVYFTNSLLPEHVRLRRIAREEEYLGWGMTTSVVEEAIANFRWGGMLFPLFALGGLFFIQRLSFIPRCVAFSIFILLLGVQFIAIYPFYILLALGVLIWRFRKHPKKLLPYIQKNRLE